MSIRHLPLATVVGGRRNVRLAQSLVVDDHLSVLNFDNIAGHADDALDEVEVWGSRGAKDDNIAALHGAHPICQAVDQYKFAVKQSRVHAETVHAHSRRDGIDSKK